MNLLVIPAFNEEPNVPRLLEDLEAHPAVWSGGRVFVIDDGSTDATARLLEDYAGPVPLTLLRQPANAGPGRAFDRGFRAALDVAGPGDLVVTMESDTTSDLAALDRMLDAAQAGADVVLATHHAGGELVNVVGYRRVLSRAASFAIRRSAGIEATTVSSFFRVYRAEALRAGYARFGDRFIVESGFACKAEILVKLTRLGASVAEVPVSLDWSRRQGRSKLRVLPTIGGYARVLARQAVTRTGAT